MHGDFLQAAAAAVPAFVVYGLTCGRDVTGEDSGELITAAYTLGIAHPPGYPLWCLLAKGCSLLVPLGSVAFRVALLSSFLGALTVGGVYLILRTLSLSAAVSLVGSWALAFSLDFWSQCVIAEVYTLNTALLSLVLLFLLQWHRAHEDRHLLAFAFVFGLGLANHTTMLALGPIFALFVLASEWRVLLRWRTLRAMLLLVLPGLSIYLYLPLRSAADPPMDWGNPETWRGFLAHVTREQYRFAITDTPRSLGLTLRQVVAWCGIFLEQFTPWLVPVILLGAWRHLRAERKGGLLLAAVFAAGGAGIMVLLNTRLEREPLTAYRSFYLPAYVAAAVWLGLGLELLTRWMSAIAPRRPWPRGASSMAILAVPATLLWLHYVPNQRRDYPFARDYATNLAATMKRDAIFFPSSDHATFPLVYLQLVEGLRPDVTIGGKYGYPDATLVWDRIVERGDRPVYFSKKRSLPPGHVW